MSRFEEKDVAVFGVSFDTEQENRAFVDKFSFPFDLLCDTGHAIGEAYGAFDPEKPQYARRISYVIDPAGTVRAVFAKVTPATHAEDLLAAL